MNQEALKELLSKYLAGIPLTDEEQRQLQAWDDSFDKMPRLTEQLSDSDKSKIRQRLWKHIDAHTNLNVHLLPSSRRWVFRIAVAASLVIFIGIAWLIISRKDKQIITSQPVAPMEIVPGGNKAILTLSNGRNIVLEDAKNGLVAQQGNMSILKVDNGQISYNADTDVAKETGYNTIRTPPGGQFTVTLPDGTKVTLNAASSLRYPVAFTGAERYVELTGEAYFDVIHNEAIPFVVKAGSLTIRDLGTSFNINVYDDEPEQQVTLISGLADVTHAEVSLRLHPGNAAQLTGNDMVLKDADVDNVTAWKNGLFQYKATSLDRIMRQIARWYDVQVIYEAPVRKAAITGKVLRTTSLKEMLKILELSGVHFRVENRTIYVTG